ncbi:hypothetical protein ABPG77_009353 [Micractinium sp. CCAP 211/92]
MAMDRRACWRRCVGAFSSGQGEAGAQYISTSNSIMSFNTCKAFAGSTCACTTVNRPPLPTASSSGDRSIINMQMSATSWCRQTPWQPGRRPRPACRSLVALAASSSSGSSSGSSSARPAAADLLTFAEVQEIARERGLEISVKTLGPAYRIVCRDTTDRQPDRRRASSMERAAAEAGEGVGGTGRVLAVTSGFLVPPPLGLMHCDTLQVFTRGQRGEEGARTRGGALGLGLLMGAATFSFGVERGCRKAEILAINDDDAWHDRLVAYYSRFGFVPVRKVNGDSLADLPHMLVWGGAGTRLDADVPEMLRRWTPAVRRNSAAKRATQAAGSPTAEAAQAAEAAEAAAADDGR